MKRPVIAALSLLILSGCGANFTTAYRTYSPIDDGPKSVLIDAKQRAILVAPGVSNTGGKEAARTMLVCAEPSPDALSAISSSLSASFGGLFPSGANVQAALAQALSETASQLGVRNATIQLLRDGLYRQCEAYMNGLITQDYYEQISNKYVNAMVALLAIEQLAPVGASSTTLRASDGGKVSTRTTVNVKGPLPSGNTTDGETEGTEETTAEESGAQPAPAEGTDPQGTTSSEELEADASEGPSGSSQATGEAVGPAVSVNVPSGNQRSIPEHVSKAVNTMVTWFLTKDTVDYCLRGLFLGTAGNNQRLNDDFVEVCKKVIVDQMAQQGALADALAIPSGGFHFKSDECSDAIRSFWQPGGVISQANRTRINEAMGQLGVSAPLPQLLNAEELSQERHDVGSALGLPACK